MVLPVQDYFPGVTLPPHLSPFEIVNDLYVPPEKERLEAMQRGEIPVHAFGEEEKSDQEGNDSDKDAEDQEEKEVKEEEEEDKKEEKLESGKQQQIAEEEHDPEKEKILAEMSVTPGSQLRRKSKAAFKEDQEQYRLAVSMIPRKKKKLYKVLRRKETRQFVNAELRRHKRKDLDNQMVSQVEKRKKEAKEAAEKMLQKKRKN
ncbi:mRNA-binding ribosome synthesis protein [Halocaridina rubra]|uniref:mRNA-binding ribosome synthesis protein n=1 Tax=Halocaridina rubra TaxID=373956 RepID=A0AAN8WWV0_HALRR